MCDRYSITADITELQDQFEINKIMASYTHQYNISPTHSVPIIIGKRQERKLVESRWGLFPFWAKDSINADYDSIKTKPVFERILKKHRCIIPSTGFYGFRPEGKKQKQNPVRIVLTDKPLFGMAGLYEERVDPRGKLHRSCTIVTTGPNRLIADYASRMPVILEGEALDEWMSPVSAGQPFTDQQFEPYSAKRMQAYPVTVQLLNEQHNSPDCIEEYQPQLAWVKH
jgi:putative SOS response-associated peptidase YedK